MSTKSTPKKNRYVLGFMFDESRQSVVLIRKNKPEWQKGLLNGVGGKIKKHELAFMAMVREFEEETGVETTAADWQMFCRLTGNDWVVLCYVAFSTEATQAAATVTDEVIFKFSLAKMPNSGMLPNVRWLVEMAAAAGVETFCSEVTYDGDRALRFRDET